MLFFLFYSATVDSPYTERTTYQVTATYEGTEFSFEVYTENENEITFQRETVQNPYVAFEIPESITFSDPKTIPITRCNGGAFSNSNLKEIIFSSSIVTFNRRTFVNAKATRIDFSKSAATSFPREFLYDAPSLEAVELPPNLAEIPYACFADCINLTQISIPDNILLNDDGYMFFECFSLATIDLSNGGFEHLPDYCFYLCTSLVDIKLPEICVTAGSFPFYGVAVPNFEIYFSSLSEGLLAGTTVVTYDFSSYKDEAIPNSVCMDCYYLEAVNFGTKINSIGDQAFMNCLSLKISQIPIPVSIGSSIFNHCPLITFFDLSNQNFNSLRSRMFYNTSISSIVLPDTIINIEDRVFYLTPIQTINFPSALEDIGSYCFYETPITTLMLKHTVIDYIRDHAFMNCQNLETVVLSSSSVTLGESTFRNCSSLVHFSCTGNTYFIGENTFYNCTILKTALFGRSSNIAKYTFGYCSSLYSVSFLPSNTMPDGADFAGARVGVYTYSFEGCTSIKHVFFSTENTELTYIGENAFSGCSGIETVDLTNCHCTYLYQEAFINCVNLRYIKIRYDMESIQRNTFLNIPELTILYCGTVEIRVRDEIFSPDAIVHYYATSNLSLRSIQPTIIPYCTLDPNYEEDESSSLNDLESESNSGSLSESSEMESISDNQEGNSDNSFYSSLSEEIIIPTRSKYQGPNDSAFMNVGEIYSPIFINGAVIGGICAAIAIFIAIILFCYFFFRGRRQPEYIFNAEENSFV